MSERWPGGRPRSGHPLVEVMEPTDLWDGHYAPKLGRMHLAWLGTVVVERLVWPSDVVVADVAVQEPAEMSLVQDEAMIQALTADRADDAFDERVLQSCRLQRVLLIHH
jgi:hypothetical protein